MVRDLQRKHLTVGARKSEIVALLGRGRTGVAASRLFYSIGMCSGHQYDYDSLVICFDAQERLTESFTMQH